MILLDIAILFKVNTFRPEVQNLERWCKFFKLMNNTITGMINHNVN